MQIKIIIWKQNKYINIPDENNIDTTILQVIQLLKDMLDCKTHNFEHSWTWFEDKRVRNDNWKLYYPSHSLYRCSKCWLESKFNS